MKKGCLVCARITLFRAKYFIENLGWHEVKIIIPPWNLPFFCRFVLIMANKRNRNEILLFANKEWRRKKQFIKIEMRFYVGVFYFWFNTLLSLAQYVQSNVLISSMLITKIGLSTHPPPPPRELFVLLLFTLVCKDDI